MARGNGCPLQGHDVGGICERCASRKPSPPTPLPGGEGSRRLTSDWRWGLVIFLGVLLAIPRPASAVDDDVLRDRVKTAIERGQKTLIAKQRGDGSFDAGHLNNIIGANSLVGIALLNSGLPPKDPAIQGVVRFIRTQQDSNKTYDLGLGIMFLAAVGEPRDRGRIEKWARMLVDQQQENGAWGYGKEVQHGLLWDNSNTQFAVLGLREAAFTTGVPIDRKVWERAQRHWMNCQSGATNAALGSGWGYTGDGGGDVRGSMSVAGVAAMEITNSFLIKDRLDAQGKLDCCGEVRDPAAESIDAGVRWLNNNVRIGSNPAASGAGHLYYYLYGLERAGKFSGQRFFGNVDWYREGASYMVDMQSPVNATWSGDENQIVGTSLALLFLSKGLSPVLINKLQYGPRRPGSNEILRPDWNRHRNDVSNLVDHISTKEGWPKYLSWQTLDLKVAVKREGVSALQQAPIAYLTGDQDLDSISEEEMTLLREYVNQGGFLLAVQNCESPAFDKGFRDLVTRLFPAGDYALRKLDPTHDIYRSEQVFTDNPPELWGVDFGCRTAIVYAPYDHACRWSKWMKHDTRTNTDIKLQIGKSMLLGVNIVSYATGRELRDKLQRPEEVKLDDVSNERGLTIGRLKHKGGWDTAANAVRHLQTALNKVQVNTSAESPIIAPNDPALFDCPLLYMHGRKNFSIAPEETTPLKAYFENGGFLMADACCGAKPFDQSFRKMIKQIFNQDLKPIPVEHVMFNTMLGYDVRRVKRRIPAPGQTSALNAEESIGDPIFEGIEINGRYVVVYSKYDLSCAIERQQTVACAGYLNEDAVKLAVNIVLYSLFQ